MKTEQFYITEIANEIRRIMAIEHNKDITSKFMDTLDEIKPKS
jgi:hypothetical protein